ncbi:MAG: hypothetical protein B9J98_05600 [Candidatus Terraquivivens tikiterensis]|uniref:Uncharacterized protein n=1 Tax=Candidatus Terraquivivens tikiterensis TaxID=1980982 RepID=A0A2R7Y296_9ARCH|nr:MAG: hypothetical protein B9J98_05600 [Candidatus Terraquivivens tikiterensis]
MVYYDLNLIFNSAGGKSCTVHGLYENEKGIIFFPSRVIFGVRAGAAEVTLAETSVIAFRACFRKRLRRRKPALWVYGIGPVAGAGSRWVAHAYPSDLYRKDGRCSPESVNRTKGT